LDIHLTGDQATPEERVAVDRELGEPASYWEGGERQAFQDGRVAFTGHESRGRRHLLPPTLHAVQERIGWISHGAVNYIAQRLDIAPKYTKSFRLRHVRAGAAAARGGTPLRRYRVHGSGGTVFRLRIWKSRTLWFSTTHAWDYVSKRQPALVTAAGVHPRARVVAPDYGHNVCLLYGLEQAPKIRPLIIQVHLESQCVDVLWNRV
jgi:hypothetical protein